MSLRKDEQLSSIPWLNKKLLKFELAPYLRKMLSQAALDWSPGRLLLMTAAGFALPPYILYFSYSLFSPGAGRGRGDGRRFLLDG